MKTLRMFVMLSVAVAIALPVLAADKKAEKKAEKKAPKCPAAAYVEATLQGITVTAEQKAKLCEIQKQFGPKLVGLGNKREAIYTPEQKKVIAEAVKEARAAGKKGKELHQAIDEAAKPTAEQKAKLAEAKAEIGQAYKGLSVALQGVLTPEQKEQLKKLQPAKKPHAK